MVTDGRSGVGPGTGAIVAVIFYRFILILHYEMANPGQDEESEKKAEAAAADAQMGRIQKTESPV